MATNADFEILAEAQIESRIVLTNDKDFGDIARFTLNCLPSAVSFSFDLKAYRLMNPWPELGK